MNASNKTIAFTIVAGFGLGAASEPSRCRAEFSRRRHNVAPARGSEASRHLGNRCSIQLSYGTTPN
jgi:hypothetical protein